MRFITEFESTYGGESQQRYIEKIPYWEERGQAEMGNLIGKSFGWKQHEVLSETRHTLEIEAFPIDKWVEFKQKLFSHLQTCAVHNTPPDGNKILSIFEELESYGKPELLTEPEYRGPGSHCKACEDEAAGIKHIMAQKHTCKK